MIKYLTRIMLMLFFILPFACLCPDNLKAAELTCIALIEGGEYKDYQDLLYAFVNELAAKNILPNKNAPQINEQMSSQELWGWLVQYQNPKELSESELKRNNNSNNNSNDNSDEKIAKPKISLFFQPDGYYSAAWNEEKRGHNYKVLAQRIEKDKDIDLVLAMGTWATVDMATKELNTKIMCLSSSDAFSTGIMASPLDSGKDNVYIMVEPDRLPRQVAFFHSLFKFKNLGITYDSGKEGASQVGLETIKKVTDLLGVNLLECKANFDVSDIELNYERLLSCHKELATKVDAMYLTVNNAFEGEKIKPLLEPFIQNKIPTFAQDTFAAVEQGALLDIARASPESEGVLAAHALIEIVLGVKPRLANNWIENNIEISLNIATARKIGWKPPFKLLTNVELLYGFDEKILNKIK